MPANMAPNKVKPIASCPIFNCPIKNTPKRMVPLIAPKSDCNHARERHGDNLLGADAKIKTSDPCQTDVLVEAVAQGSQYSKPKRLLYEEAEIKYHVLPSRIHSITKTFCLHPSTCLFILS